MKKTVFIIPGFRQKPTAKAYKQIARMLTREGYTPVPVEVSWKETTITQNTEFFLKKYNKLKRKKKYILGFSFGAMIAFLAATKVKTSGLILCSLSPYFKEDVKKLSLDKTSNRYQDFLTLKCTKLVKQVKAKQILMLYGAKETSSLIKRVEYAFSHLTAKRKYLIPVQKTEHNIADKRYLSTIHQATLALV